MVAIAASFASGVGVDVGGHTWSNGVLRALAALPDASQLPAGTVVACVGARRVAVGSVMMIGLGVAVGGIGIAVGGTGFAVGRLGAAVGSGDVFTHSQSTPSKTHLPSQVGLAVGLTRVGIRVGLTLLGTVVGLTVGGFGVAVGRR